MDRHPVDDEVKTGCIARLGKADVVTVGDKLVHDQPLSRLASQRPSSALGHGGSNFEGKGRRVPDIFGPDCAELINVFAFAIKLGLTAAQVKAMPAAYPTGASDIGSMF